MTKAQIDGILHLIDAIGITLASLAGLPQTLGPVADILPEKYKITILTVSLGAIVLCRGITAFWPFIVSLFPQLGAEPSDIRATAADALPAIPVLPADTTPQSPALAGRNEAKPAGQVDGRQGKS